MIMPPVHAGHSGADYAAALHALFPHGRLWPRDPGAVQSQTITAMAVSWARNDAQARALLQDAFPAAPVELLPEWEASLGLPDACSPLESSVQQRQQAVVAKLIAYGGASISCLVALAASLGYPITIAEFASFRADFSRADDADNDDAWDHAWQVNAPYQVIDSTFVVDASFADEPLDSYQTGVMECRLRAVAPAHTVLLFAYGAVFPPDMTNQSAGQVAAALASALAPAALAVALGLCIAALPTAMPVIAGVVWNDGGLLAFTGGNPAPIAPPAEDPALWTGSQTAAAIAAALAPTALASRLALVFSALTTLQPAATATLWNDGGLLGISTGPLQPAAPSLVADNRPQTGDQVNAAIAAAMAPGLLATTLASCLFALPVAPAGSGSVWSDGGLLAYTP